KQIGLARGERLREHDATVLDDDVGRPEIVVHDALRVRFLERITQLQADHDRAPDGQGALAELISDRVSAHGGIVHRYALSVSRGPNLAATATYSLAGETVHVARLLPVPTRSSAPITAWFELISLASGF